jgi:hypothetical protein
MTAVSKYLSTREKSATPESLLKNIDVTASFESEYNLRVQLVLNEHELDTLKDEMLRIYTLRAYHKAHKIYTFLYCERSGTLFTSKEEIAVPADSEQELHAGLLSETEYSMKADMLNQFATELFDLHRETVICPKKIDKLVKRLEKYDG